MEKVEKTTKQQEQERSAAIMLAVEMESTFKMYAYHILSHEQFFERVKELNEVFKYSISQKKKHDQLDGQLDLVDQIENQNK